MPAPKLTTTVAPLDDFNSMEEYLRYIAGLLARNSRETNWLAGNLDSENIKLKGITADRIQVNELSALSADLGLVVAGIIVGALIKTAESGQRVELSSVDNLLKAINNAGATVSIKPNVTGSPAIEYKNGVDTVTLFLVPGAYSINTTSSLTDITIASGKNININPAGGYYAILPAWSRLLNASSGQTLQNELDGLQSEVDGKANAFYGYTGSFSVVTGVDFVAETTTSKTVSVSNGIITSVT